MADFTKAVSTLIPVNERSQVFNQTEVSAGDIIRVYDSLGKPASRVLIEAVGAMTVRFNVYQKVYPTRTYKDDYWSQWGGEIRNLVTGTEVLDSEDSATVHPVAANSTYELQDDIPVKDIQVVTAAGNFTITVM